MNIDQIATTQLNNTKIHLLQTEFDELILALEKWNQPNNARPYGESNAYIIKLNHPPKKHSKYSQQSNPAINAEPTTTSST